MSTAPASRPVTAELREGSYGDQVLVVEPGGAGMVPDAERHGRPLDLLWTWTSPNLEFATVFVGFIAIAFFGQSFAQAVVAIVVGTALGSITMGVLSARGPRTGLPQMITSRVAFGRLGNVLPAGINTVTAGIGWFAVNAVSGALALAALTHLPKLLSLLIVVVLMMTIAFFGHNLIQAFERYVVPVLGVIFLVAVVIIFSKAHPGSVHQHGGTGGFLLTVGAAFGYAAGWNPYASDYTRYLPSAASARLTGLFAGLGVFLSCVVLETVGAALLTIKGVDPFGANPTGEFAGQLGAWRDVTLLAIAIGSIAANVLNVYSGAMSFLAVGIELPLRLRRAIAAVSFGIVGAILAATSLNEPDRYENFLLIIAYWIGPWLGVFLTDQLLRRGKDVSGLPFDRKHNPFAGVIAMAAGMAVSITLFSNQSKFQGFLARHHPGLGDIAFEVGFLVAAAVYAGLFFLERQQSVEEAAIVPETAPQPA
ncbi:MAG TPA: cytosine permease [Mycobacteriales bacterium]